MNEETICQEIQELMKIHVIPEKTHSLVNSLLLLLEDKNKKIHFLEKKTEVLKNQLLELTNEMENIKSDFGGFR